MYNPRVIKKPAEATVLTMTAGAAISENDFVSANNSGKVIPTTSGPIFGIALESAANEEEVRVLRAQPGVVVLMDNDGSPAATSIGKCFPITGGTGAQLVDTSEGALDSGQLFCIAINPQGFGYDSDTSIGLYEIAEIQGLTNTVEIPV